MTKLFAYVAAGAVAGALSVVAPAVASASIDHATVSANGPQCDKNGNCHDRQDRKGGGKHRGGNGGGHNGNHGKPGGGRA